MSDFHVQLQELTGFGLGGYVAPSGVIKLTGSGRYISAWPEEITILGNTYALENVIKGTTNPKTGDQWQNAEYC